jgi:hypothetical protein
MAHSLISRFGDQVLVTKGRIEELVCTRCGYRWFPRKFTPDGKPVEPKKCPNQPCGSPYWKEPPLTKAERAEATRQGTRAYWRDQKRADK